MGDKDGDVVFGPGPAVPAEAIGARPPANLLFMQGVAGPLFQQPPASAADEGMGAANAAPAAVPVGGPVQERGSAEANAGKALATPAAAAPAAPMTFQLRRSERARKAVERFGGTEEKEDEKEDLPLLNPGEQGAGLRRLREKGIGPREFNDASELLLPIGLRSRLDDTEALGTSKVTLNDFFTKGLTDVCESVFGPRLTKRLAVEFTAIGRKPTIRDFFELDSAGSQCKAVLVGVAGTEPVMTHCWICGTKTGDEGDAAKECEHKLPILPALLLTGLYDRRLQAEFAKEARNNDYQTYKQLLRPEYAYAHRRCNQVKSDVVFATPVYIGRGEKTISCVPDTPSITSTLTDILTRQAPTYTPQPDALREKLRTEPNQWDGVSPTATLPPGFVSDAAWVSGRTSYVGSAIAAAIAKFNSKALTAKGAKLQIVNAMLTRALILARDLAKEELWDSLTSAGKAMVTRSLNAAQKGRGRRHRTRHTRPLSRRRQRGGEDEPDDIWVDLACARIKERALPNLVDRLTSAFELVRTPDDYSKAVQTVIAEHIAATDAIVNKMLENFTPDLVLGGDTSESASGSKRARNESVAASADVSSEPVAPGPKRAAAAAPLTVNTSAPPSGMTTPAPPSPRSVSTARFSVSWQQGTPGSSGTASPVKGALVFSSPPRKLQAGLLSQPAASAAPGSPSATLQPDDAMGERVGGFGPKPNWF